MMMEFIKLVNILDGFNHGGIYMYEPKLITESYLKRWKKNSFTSAILWTALGIILMFFHNKIDYITCYLVGITLLLQGVPHLFLFVIEEEKHFFSISSLINGIIICFFGIWALTLPDQAKLAISDIIAIVVLLHGFKAIALSRRIQCLEKKLGYLSMVISIATILFAIIILFSSIHRIDFCSGILIIIDGIENFWMWKILSKKSDEHRGI